MTALVRAASLTGYSDLVRDLGGDPRRLLSDCGLTPLLLENPDMKISADTVGRLLERTAEQLGAPDFGLRLAEARRPSNLGPVSLVARDQASLRQALEVMRQYQWLHNEALSLTLEEDGEIAVLSLALLAGSGLASRQATELSVAVLTRTLSALLGGAWRADSVHFRHAAPASVVTHRRVLGISPFFDQPFDGLVLPRETLSEPLPAADPLMALQARRYAEQLAAGRLRSWTGAARELIILLLPTGRCGADEVARLIGVNRRTLHRRLAAEGESFRGLLAECRGAMTESLITSGTSKTRISELVGFSSPSSFAHWRRRAGADKP